MNNIPTNYIQDRTHVDDICKINHEENTCRYLGYSTFGFRCEKHNLVGRQIDERVENNRQLAKGDNCEGFK